jgi:hypothetical protein
VQCNNQSNVFIFIHIKLLIRRGIIRTRTHLQSNNNCVKLLLLRKFATINLEVNQTRKEE